MKVTQMAKGLLLGLTLLLATGAFAANKGSLQVFDPIVVNGQKLPVGEYSLRWEGDGPNVELNILQGHKVMATTPARVVSEAGSSSRDLAVLKVNEDGSKSLSEVRFAGKKYSLAIGEATQTSAMGSTK